jgi:hypothetical protein
MESVLGKLKHCSEDKTFENKDKGTFMGSSGYGFTMKTMVFESALKTFK